MIEHLIYACILVLIQAWILPAAFNTKNMQWMLSNRDAKPDTTLYYDRSKKAYANLQESIPVFFLLGLLGSFGLLGFLRGLSLWGDRHFYHISFIKN